MKKCGLDMGCDFVGIPFLSISTITAAAAAAPTTICRDW